jgi:hypothetical protein
MPQSGELKNDGLSGSNSSADPDGKATEVQKCGFGPLNRRFGGYGRLGIMAVI